MSNRRFLGLIAVSQAAHSTHDAEDVVVDGVDTHLGGLGSFHGGVGEDKLQGGIVDTGEVAGTRWLVFFGAEGEGVDVDAFIWSTGVCLERLDPREVGTFTFREAILAVELQLGGDDWVLAPAVHVQGGFGKDESAGVGNPGVDHGLGSWVGKIWTEVWTVVGVTWTVPVATWVAVVQGAGVVEETAFVDVSPTVGGDAGWTAEGVDGVWQGIDGVGVVEWLGTQDLVQQGVAGQGRAVINVLIWLDNPDEFLDRMVEVQLDLVGRGTDGFVTSELELGDEVFVWVLGHSATFVGVQEDVVDVDGGGDQGLVVGDGGWDWATGLVAGGVARQGGDGPQALVNWANVQVDLDFVVLQGDQWQGKAWVGAKPKLKWDVQGGFWEGIARGADLARSSSITRGFDVGEGWVGDEGELGGVADHLEVVALLLGGHGQLVPDVHPVTILTINALATDFHFHLRNQLFADVVQPAGIDSGWLGTAIGGNTHHLVDFRKGDLQIGAVCKIAVAGNGAGNTTTKISLAIEGLFNGFNGEVGVSAVSYLPESDLWVSGKIDILGTVGHKLHQGTTVHCCG